MMFAGIWDILQGEDGLLRTFALITTTANDTALPIHDRMPVIVESGDWPVWLGEEDGNAASLLHPCETDIIRVWLVSRRVNSPANNDARLLDAMAAPS